MLWGDIAHAIDIGHKFRVPEAGGFLFKVIDIIRNRGGAGESALGISLMLTISGLKANMLASLPSSTG